LEDGYPPSDKGLVTFFHKTYNDFSSARLDFSVFLVHLFDVVSQRVKDDTLANPGTWRDWLDKGNNRQGMYSEVLKKTLHEVRRFFGTRVTCLQDNCKPLTTGQLG
jgi:hypothetical protein